MNSAFYLVRSSTFRVITFDPNLPIIDFFLTQTEKWPGFTNLAILYEQLCNQQLNQPKPQATGE